VPANEKSANNHVLLVLREGSTKQRLSSASPVEPDIFIFPLSWYLLKRLQNSELLDANLVLWRVDGQAIVGLAGPGALGAPLFAYVLLILTGWLTLSTPLKVRLKLLNPKTLSLEQAKNYIAEIVRQSESDRDIADSLLQRIERARSFAGIIRAVDDAYL
jgi:hypothetical protein